VQPRVDGTYGTYESLAFRTTLKTATQARSHKRHLAFSRVNRNLNLRTGRADALQRFRREPDLLESTTRASRLHTDIEYAPVRFVPSLSSTASQDRDVLKKFLRGSFCAVCDTPRIHNQPPRLTPTFRDNGLTRPRPGGREGCERPARPHIEVDGEELGVLHRGRI
jgi:hypothetical protein